MSIDRDLLVRYLRQRAEMGETTLFLETAGRRELAAALRGEPLVAPDRVGAAAPHTRAAPTAAAAVAATEPDRPAAQSPRATSAAAAAAVGVAAPATVAARAGPEAGSAEGRATELRALQTEAEACVRCALHETRSNVVFGVGNAAADLVVVGEAPGRQEDLRGQPFVGPAGKLLDLLLASIGLDRDVVFICNVLKCRPPQNRNPQPAEVECCSPYLHRQLELIQPRVLVAVGKFAAQTLLDTDAPIGRLRGRVHEYRGIPLIATFHPAYLLRSRGQVRAGWGDLQLARRVLDAAGR